MRRRIAADISKAEAHNCFFAGRLAPKHADRDIAQSVREHQQELLLIESKLRAMEDDDSLNVETFKRDTQTGVRLGRARLLEQPILSKIDALCLAARRAVDHCDAESSQGGPATTAIVHRAAPTWVGERRRVVSKSAGTASGVRLTPKELLASREKSALKQRAAAKLELQEVPVSYTHLTLPTIYSV